jgi:para-nitrobenzyl esterase
VGLESDPALTSFAPSIDYYVLNGAPGQIFTDGQQQKVPVLAGWNFLEILIFPAREPPHATAAEYEAGLQALFGNHLPQALQLYSDSPPVLLNVSAGALIGDLIIREQTWEAANKQA